jgi:hypothetical protein
MIVWIASWSATATRAEAQAAVELTVDPCLQSIERSLRAILPIEMASIGVIDSYAGDDHERADLRASIGCDGDDVVLRVRRVDTGEVLEDRLSLPDHEAPGTARTIALALSELVTTAHPPSAEPEPEPAVSWLVSGAFVVRTGVDHGPWMGGLSAEASRSLRPFLRVFAGAEWTTGARGTALGDVLATSLTVDGGASFGHAREGSWFGADVGGRVGAVLWNGKPSLPDVLGPRDAAPFLGFFARLVAEASLTDALRVRGAFELGLVAVGSRGVAADASTTPPMIETVEIDRLWFGFSLGFVYAP